MSTASGKSASAERGRVLPALAAHPLRAGGALAVVLVAVHAVLDRAASIELAAATLCVIAGVYMGFALSHARDRVAVVESGTAVAFGVVALLGLWVDPAFVIGGLVLHALWDLAHHRRAGHGRWAAVLAPVPPWYVPLCAVVDLGLAAGLAVLWL
jgi:hypothetical protein